MRARYAAQKQEFINYLGDRCVKCGTLYDLTIDHIDPQKKEFTVSRLWARKDLPKVFKELDKCQLLCEDCHVEKTALEQAYEHGWRHGTFYGWMKKKCNCYECQEAKQEFYLERNKKRRKPDGYGPRKFDKRWKS